VEDLARVRDLARAALASLEASRPRIDDLNVYPVPDGDTGTNLTLTVRAVVEQLEVSTAATRDELAREVTRAALLGARGNSGVIFSQIVRGAAESLAAAEVVDGEAVTRALRSAADTAYAAVRKPVEGTILSAIRALADEAARRPPDLWRELVRAGECAVARTPEQLDVLREAGVVDAGAAGLLEIVRGVAAAITGEELPPLPAQLERIGVDAIHVEDSRYRYCTTFVVEGDALDVSRFETEVSALGDSLLVVGDESALKIHVHTDDPGAALSLGTSFGTIDRVEIANMHAQTTAREERLQDELAEAASGVIAVVAGNGNRALFESLGAAAVVEGGQTMNPSAAELVAAVAAVPAREVVVLPNNSNVVLAAEQASQLASKHVDVVATDSIQAGLAAIVAFDPTRAADENAQEMREALAGVDTGEVTVASRDVQLNGVSIKKGAFLGLANGEPVSGGGDFDEVANAVAERLLSTPRDVLTLLTGADEPSLDRLVARLRSRYPELELEVQHGGQPHYPLLLSAE
jgi:DAK2 domain fusion protein YloV